MGAGKSIPVVSEVLTTGESVGKLIGAAGASIAGNEEAAKQLLKGAGDAWTDYAERQPIAAGINMAVREIQGDEKGARKVGKKMVQSIEDLADSTPVVGHVKGIVHYATGDREHGDKCMKGASKSLVVAGVTAATAGAGAIVAGSIAVGSSAGMDSVITLCDSAAHNEYKPHGEYAAIDLAIKTKDPNAIANAVLAPIAEFGMAAVSETIGNRVKTARARKTAQKDSYSAASRSAKTLREAPIDKKTANSVSTTVKNTKTGKAHTGVSSNLRRKIDPDKAAAMSRPDYKSSLQQRAPLEGKPALNRNPTTCAEHAAYDSYYASNATAKNAVEASVQRNPKTGDLTVVKRCGNCKQYESAMSAVDTKLIGTDMTNPVQVASRAASLSRQVTAYTALQVAEKVVSGVVVSSVPPGDVAEVRKVNVWISNDRHITCIQFILRNSQKFKFGERAEGDVVATRQFSIGERIKRLELVKREKKLVGLALHIDKREKPIIFGAVEREDCEVEKFDAPSGLHIIGLKEEDGKEVAVYSQTSF
ncbi:uncharacterized protein [Oscarella lobularis]|uniref:uncharacterized protein n=1 Tax=Oscarella lobularis TaxID=121494 RepID=UPI0033137811